MTKVVIKEITVSDVFNAPNFQELKEEYKKESAILGLPDPDGKLSTYLMLESSQMFSAFGAYLEDQLIGFISVITPVVPHYGVSISVAESLFVLKRYRMSGAGIKLIWKAEELASRKGSPGLLLSFPHESKVDGMMPRLGFRETNRVYFKEFHNGDGIWDIG